MNMKSNHRFLQEMSEDYSVYAVANTTLSPETVDEVGGQLGRCVSAPLSPGRRTFAFRTVADREAFMLDFKDDHDACVALSLEDAITK